MWQIIGQYKAVSFLQRSLEKGAVAHAYLFVGPPHVGKMTLAVNLAQALNCEATETPCGECPTCQKISSASHPDIQVIGLIAAKNSGEAKSHAEISIDQIREMQHSANLPPFSGRNKIFIIDGAELLSNEAANCLLKTLEEPASGIVFILLTRNDRLLPATVVSRCQRLELLPVGTGEIAEVLQKQRGMTSERAQLLARLCHGCIGWAFMAASDVNVLALRAERLDGIIDIIYTNLEERFAYAAQLAKQFSQNREQGQEVLDLWLNYWRDLLLVKAGLGDNITNVDRSATIVSLAGEYRLAQIRAMINSIQAAGEELRQNANPRLVLEVLMFDMPVVNKKTLAV